MTGVSLFSSAGIAETYLEDVGVNIIQNDLQSINNGTNKTTTGNCKININTLFNITLNIF